MIKLVTSLLLLGIAISGNAAEPEKTAEEIVKDARFRPSEKSFYRDCTLRKGFKKTDFTLSRTAGENVIEIEFEDSERAVLMKVRKKAKGIRFSERDSDGVETKMKKKQLHEPIHGTDVTYEDLARSFLYWPKPKILGSEKLIKRMRDCWIIRIDNPKPKSGPYSVVKIWIDKETDSLLKIERYNWEGRIVRRAEVSQVQRDRSVDKWITEEMSIESIDHESGRKSVTTISLGKLVVE